jgi:hypothetical protein
LFGRAKLQDIVLGGVAARNIHPQAPGIEGADNHVFTQGTVGELIKLGAQTISQEPLREPENAPLARQRTQSPHKICKDV